MPDIEEWKLEKDKIIELKQLLKLRYSILKEKISQKNKLAILKEELSELKTEEKHFLQYFDSSNIQAEARDCQKINTSKIALEMWILCEESEEVLYNKCLFELIKRLFGFLKLK